MLPLQLVYFVALIVIGNLVFVCRTTNIIDPSRILISITLDENNNEILYEGFILLKSLQIFGKSLKKATVDLCIATDNENINPSLILKLQEFNVSSIRRQHRSQYAQSLNKLCSFESPLVSSFDYFLYLDADIFVARDPMPLITAFHKDDSILCGRPWDTFPNISYFPEFLGVPSPFFEYPLLEVINIGGYTYYGMCNTGMYFMRSTVALDLVIVAKQYLQKSITNTNFNSYIPFDPSYFGIDSVILWAAQYLLGRKVVVAPPALNYIAAAEDVLLRFVEPIHISSDTYSTHRIEDRYMDDEVIRVKDMSYTGPVIENNPADRYTTMTTVHTGTNPVNSFNSSSSLDKPNDSNSGTSYSSIISDSSNADCFTPGTHCDLQYGAPTLIHFSRGSHARFRYERDNASSGTTVRCSVSLVASTKLPVSIETSPLCDFFLPFYYEHNMTDAYSILCQFAQFLADIPYR